MFGDGICECDLLVAAFSPRSNAKDNMIAQFTRGSNQASGGNKELKQRCASKVFKNVSRCDRTSRLNKAA